MNKFLTVLQFEFLSFWRKKSVKIGSLVFALVAFGLTFLPNLLMSLGPNILPTFSPETYGYYTRDESLVNYLEENVKNKGFELERFQSEDELFENVRSEDVSKAYIIENPEKVKGIVSDTSVFEATDPFIQNLILPYSRQLAFEEFGIDPGQVDEIMAKEVDYQVEVLGRDASSAYGLVYFSIIVIYILIITYGSIVATSIAREKSNRTMELLITSAPASYLINGKVFGIFFASLSQILLVVLAFTLGLLINSRTMPVELLELFSFSISGKEIGLLLSFLITGYIMYLYLFASLGALVSKIEEVSTSIAPVTVIFMFVYFASIIGMNFPDSLFFRIVSLIPFSSPMAMFPRYAMTTVASLDIVIALAILVITTGLLSMLAVAIYKQGTLNYGNRMGIIEAIKRARRSN